MVYGRDECMLGGLATGAVASIGNGFNIAPGNYKRLIAAFEAGDMATARAEQERSRAVVQLALESERRYGCGQIAALKAMSKLRGVDVGPPRAPYKAISDAGLEQLKADLTGLGFFDWAT
jgi:N-acetylneuraminate lyase